MNTAFRVGGDVYDNFMGRYSTVLAPLFADFVGVSPGMRALDVGAGTGALTAELLSRGVSVAAADPSPEFVTVLRERFPKLEVEVARPSRFRSGLACSTWRLRSSSSPSWPMRRPQ